MSETVKYRANAAFLLRLLAPFIVASLASVPAILVFTGQLHDAPLVDAGWYGLAIVSAAFMLGWVGEAAELDLSGGLSIGLIAVITILPEYVVSNVISFQAGTNSAMGALATANLTGANRLLIGFGWPIVAICGWIATRKSRASSGAKYRGIELEPQSKTDVAFMIWATVLSLLVPIMASINLLLGVFMIVLFVSYLWRVSQQENEEPELHGTAAYVGALPKVGRRVFLVLIAAIASGLILIAADPFTEKLIEGGHELGWNQYLLIQWITPLASEAPEFTLAFLFALRGKAQVALAVLISSKVNQWSVLTGSLPISYVLGGGQGGGLPLDANSVAEFNLTIAQSILGIALVLGMRVGWAESLWLLGTFVASFVFTDLQSRDWIAVLCLAVAVPYFVRYRNLVWDVAKTPLKAR